MHFFLILKELVEQCNVSKYSICFCYSWRFETNMLCICTLCTNSNEKPAKTYYQSLKSGGKISIWINHFVSATDCFYLFRTIPIQTYYKSLMLQSIYLERVLQCLDTDCNTPFLFNGIFSTDGTEKVWCLKR